MKNSLKDSMVLRIMKNKYLLVTVFFIVWIFFIDTNNLIRWYGHMRDLAAQQRQIEYYEEAIELTNGQLQELQSNRDSLEKFAREQYLFHEQDEEVFIVRK